MRPALPIIRKFVVKCCHEVLPAAGASVVGALLLSHFHIGASSPAPKPVTEASSVLPDQVAQLIKDDHALMVTFLQSYRGIEQASGHAAPAVPGNATAQLRARVASAGAKEKSREAAVEKPAATPRDRATAFNEFQPEPDAQPETSAPQAVAVAAMTPQIIPAQGAAPQLNAPQIVAPRVVASAQPRMPNDPAMDAATDGGPTVIMAPPPARNPDRLEPPLPVPAQWADRGTSMTTRIVRTVVSPVRWMTGTVGRIAGELSGAAGPRAEFRGSL